MATDDNLVLLSGKRMVNSREVKATSMVMLLIILMKHKSADSSLVQVPSSTTVMVNQSTYFNCSTSIRPIGPKDVIWYHYPLDRDGQRNYVYDEGRIMTNYINRFDIQKNLSTGTFNLIVMRPEPKDAGRYECVDDVQEGIGASAELTVLASNFVCESDFDSSGVVGPTQCDRAITPYEARLSCSVAYSGKNAPQMKWSKSGDSLITLNTHCGTRDNRVTCNTTLTSDLQLNGAVYICQSTSQLFNCSLEVNNVIYAFADNEIRNYFTGDEVICIANTSKQLPCSYKWKKDKTREVFPNRKLKPPDPGLYRCHAQCLIRNDSCTFTAMVINVAEISESGKTAAAVLVTLTLLILVVTIASSVAIYKKKKAYEQKLKRYVEDQSLEDLIDRIPLFKTDDLERTNENVIEEELELRGKLEKEKGDKAVLGVAILGEELYIVRERSSKLEVYAVNTFTLQRKLPKLKDLVTAVDLCSCKKNTCLYIMDQKIGPVDKDILKIDTQGKLIKKWHTHNNAAGYLSTTEEGNVIITVQEEQLLLEYSQDGSLLHVINLSEDSERINPWHAIKLHNDRFIVSYGMLFDRLHRVCLVDKHGRVQNSFGRKGGSAVDQLNMPIYLAVGSSGFVVVADLINNRVLLLDSNLEFRAKIVPRYKQRFLNPRRVYLDETKGLLIVVITAGSPRDRIPKEADNPVEETEEGGSLPESKRALNQRGEENEVDAPHKIEEDCRILAFNIKPVLEKYKLTVEGGCSEEKEESDLLA